MYRVTILFTLCCSIAAAQQPTPATRGKVERPATSRRAKPSAKQPASKNKPAKPENVKDMLYPADPAAEVEVVRERYDDGAVRIERQVTLDTEGNYIRHGNWTWFTEKGEKVAYGAYQDNTRHGHWVRVFAGNESELFKEDQFKSFTGPFVSHGDFREGKLHGEWTMSDSEGRLVFTWQFQDGKRHGVWNWHYPSGKKLRQISYNHGLIDGSLHVWNEAGESLAEQDYQGGRRLAMKTERHKSGAKKSEGMYLFAKRIIESEDQWWDAKPAKYSTVGADDRHGEWNSWHENGQLECRGAYHYGQRDGGFQWWYPNGQRRLKGEYVAGKEVGDWVWWHSNGQKATLGQYKNGEPNGNWVFWNDGGRLIQRSEMSVASTLVQPPTSAAAGKAAAQPKSTR